MLRLSLLCFRFAGGPHPPMQLEPNESMLAKTELSEVAREARQAAGLTQTQAAERLGVNQATVSRAENDTSGSLVKLQCRLIREIGGWECDGPRWIVRRPQTK